MNTIASMDRPTLINNVVTLVKVARAYDLPIEHGGTFGIQLELEKERPSPARP